eukprot:g6420.t1
MIMRKKLVLLLTILSFSRIASTNARTYCTCGNFVSYTDSSATCSAKCSSGSTASYTWGGSTDKAQYKLITHSTACETTQSDPNVKLNFLACWDHIGYVRTYPFSASTYYFHYGSYGPPSSTECYIKLYQDMDDDSTQTKPTKLVSNGQNYMTITTGTSNQCVMQFLQIAGTDALLDMEAKLSTVSTAVRRSTEGSGCEDISDAAEACTRSYDLQYLGENQNIIVMTPHKVNGFFCYTQYCELNGAKTKCTGKDKITDVQMEVEGVGTDLVVKVGDCSAKYDITKGKILGVEPVLDGLDGAATLFTSLNLLLIALFSIASIVF